jgi:hypothetical protein
MADPPTISPASPTPTVFNTPQQNAMAADALPPPVTQVAGTSLRLAFQTPSTLHSTTTSVLMEYDEEAIAAATIDDSSLQLPSYILRLAGKMTLV